MKLIWSKGTDTRYRLTIVPTPQGPLSWEDWLRGEQARIDASPHHSARIVTESPGHLHLMVGVSREILEARDLSSPFSSAKKFPT